jgi:hypothetical protein
MQGGSLDEFRRFVGGLGPGEEQLNPIVPELGLGVVVWGVAGDAPALLSMR